MRVTFAHRLQAIIDTDGASKRDRETAADLLRQYTRTKRLSSGQSRLVRTLEAKNAPEAIAERKARTSPLIKRLTTLYGRIVDQSSWDYGFCESLLSQARNDRSLSPRQLEILEQIEARHSDEALEILKEWDQNFSPDMRERYEVCLQYYKRSAYFNRQCQEYQAAYESGTKLIPSMKDYNKIVKNKYAQKVLTAHYADPLYPVGSMVTIRSNQYRRLRNGQDYLVIKNDLPIRNACKGAKIYQLLPVGSAELVHIEERHIKKHRTRKAKR
tara:strand:- start:889 stop:1701 length:813 start_codon:yes stop_codon:yes gene_type:complete